MNFLGRKIKGIRTWLGSQQPALKERDTDSLLSLLTLSRTSLQRVKNWYGQNYLMIWTMGGVTGVILGLRFIGFLQAGELELFDHYFRLRPPEDREERIVVVGIDENDLRKYKVPVRNEYLAQLLKQINKQKPAVIGLDIYRNPEEDPVNNPLLKVFEEMNNLVGIEKLETADVQAIPGSKILLKKDQVGFNDVQTDVDARLRRNLLFTTNQKASFALQLAYNYLGQFSDNIKAGLDQSGNFYIDQAVFPRLKRNDGAYVAPISLNHKVVSSNNHQPASEATKEGLKWMEGYQIITNFRDPRNFKIVSMSDVLEGKIPENTFKKKIVIIGYTAPSVKDLFTFTYSDRPFDGPLKIPGVELHANFTSQLISSVLDGRLNFKAVPESWEILSIILGAITGTLILRYIRSTSTGLILILMISGTILVCSYGLFLLGWWFPVLPSLLSLGGSSIVMISLFTYQRHELERSTEFLQSLIDKIPDPIFVKDHQYSWIIVNEAFCEFLGYPLSDLINKTDYDYFSPSEADIFRQQEQLVLQQRKPYENEEYFTNSQGQTYLIATKRSIHQDSAGNIFLVGVIRDITERKKIEEELRRTTVELTRSNEELKRSEKKLRYMANHDPLTGLGNRKLFYETLGDLLEWGENNEQLVGLLYLDLDGFKPVNDTLGHDMGDLLLKAVGQRIKKCLRSSDVVCRLGGDEFTVILPGIKKRDDGQIVAEKIMTTISQPYMINGNNIVVTVSIGISVYPMDGTTEEVLIKNADTAMYQAKQSGRNQYQITQD